MGEELQIIPLKCVSCGADLDITPDMETFACAYCGTRQMVRREGGAIWLKEIGDAIARVQVGTDRTAAELAVRRLQEELEKITQQRAALPDEPPFWSTCAFTLGLGLFCFGCLVAFDGSRWGAVLSAIGIAVASLGFYVVRTIELSVGEGELQNPAKILEDRARIIQQKLDIELQKLED